MNVENLYRSFEHHFIQDRKRWHVAKTDYVRVLKLFQIKKLNREDSCDEIYWINQFLCELYSKNKCHLIRDWKTFHCSSSYLKVTKYVVLKTSGFYRENLLEKADLSINRVRKTDGRQELESKKQNSVIICKT